MINQILFYYRYYARSWCTYLCTSGMQSILILFSLLFKFEKYQYSSCRKDRNEKKFKPKSERKMQIFSTVTHPDSGVFWIRIQIFGRIQIQWIWILNTVLIGHRYAKLKIWDEQCFGSGFNWAINLNPDPEDPWIRIRNTGGGLLPGVGGCRGWPSPAALQQRGGTGPLTSDLSMMCQQLVNYWHQPEHNKRIAYNCTLNQTGADMNIIFPSQIYPIYSPILVRLKN